MIHVCLPLKFCSRAERQHAHNTSLCQHALHGSRAWPWAIRMVLTFRLSSSKGSCCLPATRLPGSSDSCLGMAGGFSPGASPLTAACKAAWVLTGGCCGMLTLDPASLGREEHPLCFPQGTSQLRVDYQGCQEPLSCKVCQ